MLVATFFDITNPGIRRAPPALPFPLCFASHRSRRRARATVVASLLWPARSWRRCALATPSGVSERRGRGSRGGPLVTDEAMSTGAELPRLAAWQRAPAPGRDPAALLLRQRRAPPGAQAEPPDVADVEAPRPPPTRSAPTLAWFRARGARGADSDWLEKYTPIDRVGESISSIASARDSLRPARRAA
jgi:hypothetical protein